MKQSIHSTKARAKRGDPDEGGRGWEDRRNGHIQEDGLNTYCKAIPNKYSGKHRPDLRPTCGLVPTISVPGRVWTLDGIAVRVTPHAKKALCSLMLRPLHNSRKMVNKEGRLLEENHKKKFQTNSTNAISFSLQSSTIFLMLARFKGYIIKGPAV